ncbi:MAG: ribonuclease P protein component [Mycobacteriaceae bacterium]|nr:ribonuclease P protein component [Mycobacteriaceae bacterium]
MLPEPYRLHHHSDFSRTVRRGHRIGRRDLVVHMLFAGVDSGGLSSVGGPRFGLIINKAVGNAVVRHRVARRLRHVCAELVVSGDSADFWRTLGGGRRDMLERADIVIRALPGAATASSRDLAGQVRGGVGKILERERSTE